MLMFEPGRELAKELQQPQELVLELLSVLALVPWSAHLLELESENSCDMFPDRRCMPHCQEYITHFGGTSWRQATCSFLRHWRALPRTSPSMNLSRKSLAKQSAKTWEKQWDVQ